MPDESHESKRPRRWLAVSLRLSLLLVLAVALALAGAAWKVRDQRETKEMVLNHDGVFFYEFEPQTTTRYERKTWVPAWLRQIIGEDFFHDVTYVRIEGPHFGDAELERLKAFDRIESLGIVQTAITDAGLRHLRGRKALKGLWLDGNWIGDAGIDNLGPETLPQLGLLGITQTLVSAAKVAEIKRRFPKLLIIDNFYSYRIIRPGKGRGDHRFGHPEDGKSGPKRKLPPPRPRES